MWQEMLASGDLTGLVAVCLIFGMPIIIVVAAFIYKAHQATMLRETIEHIVDKGQPVPPELLNGRAWSAGMKQANDARMPLHRGILLTATGVGLTILLLSTGLDEYWGIAMLPLLLGFGYLLIWKIDSSNGQDRQ
jgi:hypothetical protein